jgi:hypothetical protein
MKEIIITYENSPLHRTLQNHCSPKNGQNPTANIGRRLDEWIPYKGIKT